MKNIIFGILGYAAITLATTLGALSFAIVLYTFFSVGGRMCIFFGALLAIPYFVVGCKICKNLEIAIKTYRNRYILLAIHFLDLPYEVQESMLESYLKGEPNFDVEFYKRATYKLTKKPFIFVKPDGRATFTLLETYGGIERPIPYLML